MHMGDYTQIVSMKHLKLCCDINVYTRTRICTRTICIYIYTHGHVYVTCSSRSLIWSKVHFILYYSLPF